MPSGYVRVKDKVPRNGKGVQNLLIQLNQYMNAPENKYVQKIIVDAQHSYLHFEKLVPKDQAPPEAGMTWHDAIRIAPMEELGISSEPGTALDVVQDLFEVIARNGYEAAQLLIGTKSDLFKWLDLPRSVERVFGVPIQKLSEIPDDIVILCGSRARDCDPEDVEFSVKVTIP